VDVEARVESRWTTVGGVRWHARVEPGWRTDAARPVVLVHGLGVSGRYMVPLLEQLAGEFAVVAPDFPGFGQSADPPTRVGLAEMADALAEWTRAIGLRPAVMVGNSLGCQVIAHLARRHPERIVRAVLISPTMDPSARGAAGQIVRLLRDLPRERWPLQAIASRDYVEAGVWRGWRTLRVALRDPVVDTYGGIAVPALVVRGGRDPLVPAAWAEDVTRMLPRGRLVTLPDAPHAANFSAPDALARALRPFLREAG
jgi:2-hydroxy-6-oxonona-2,4-dienedioate hydrolase